MKSVIELIKLNASDRDGHHPLDILASYYIKVDKPAECYMRLVIEHTGRGPRGLEMISVAHYYELNGDQCTDPEMTFEVVREAWDKSEYWGPVSFAMNAAGIHKEAVRRDGNRVICNPNEVRDETSFSRIWSKNLREQGFITQFSNQLARPC